MSTISPFSLDDVTKIRAYLQSNPHPENEELYNLISRKQQDTQSIIIRNLPMILDPSFTNEGLVEAMNEILASPKKVRAVPPRIEPPKEKIEAGIHSALTLAIPPKFRGKPIAKTPHSKLNPFPLTPQNQPMEHYPNGNVRSIPILPRIANSTASVLRHFRDHSPPVIGSLAAVLHPSLGPAHVCRVLGVNKRISHEIDYYLVAFFQSEHSPCFVASEFLFQLKADIGFPLGDETQFRQMMLTQEISVDWLLERIFSAAQNLVINHAEVLFPPATLQQSELKPDPQQVQQIMFQCVSCAALMIVCYVSGEWSVPQSKLAIILSTIMTTNPSKYNTTKGIMKQIEDTMTQLLSLNEQAIVSQQTKV